LFSQFLSSLGIGNLAQWKETYQDLQFYFATLLAIFGGAFAWYKAHSSFKRAARLSEIIIETTGIGTREVADRPGKFEQYLWIAPVKQLQLGDLFNPLYMKAIGNGGKLQARNHWIVLRLKSQSHTKAMLLRIRSAIKELWPDSDIIAASHAARPNVPSPYRAHTFYAFLRRDSWVDDRYQSYRVVLIPKWIAERTESDPAWLSEVKIDVQHQADRLNHIRYVAEHQRAID
jgi:hypothetical protein